ncbi:MAG TPA: YggT family protein [Gaiellaceae bacterium]|nr:YggT family protein [Gaiellaceae bacterium]
MVLLDAITQVELFLNVFVGVYVLAIFLYIIASWIQLPYSLRVIHKFLYDACEPYLRIWRRILPMAGPLDLSPMVGVLALVIAERIAIAILDRFH